jgi:hypothetical protein
MHLGTRPAAWWSSTNATIITLGGRGSAWAEYQMVSEDLVRAAKFAVLPLQLLPPLWLLRRHTLGGGRYHVLPREPTYEASPPCSHLRDGLDHGPLRVVLALVLARDSRSRTFVENCLALSMTHSHELEPRPNPERFTFSVWLDG